MGDADSDLGRANHVAVPKPRAIIPLPFALTFARMLVQQAPSIIGLPSLHHLNNTKSHLAVEESGLQHLDSTRARFRQKPLSTSSGWSYACDTFALGLLLVILILISDSADSYRTALVATTLSLCSHLWINLTIVSNFFVPSLVTSLI